MDYFVTVEDVGLFPQERWCYTNNVDPEYVYDVTDFSEGIENLFLRNQLPYNKLFILDRFVNAHRDKSEEQIRKMVREISMEAEGKVTAVLSGLYREKSEKWNQLKIFMEKFTKTVIRDIDIKEIEKQIRIDFQLKEYSLYGTALSTYNLRDVFNRCMPNSSVSGILMFDSSMGLISKLNHNNSDISSLYDYMNQNMLYDMKDVILVIYNFANKMYHFTISIHDNIFLIETEKLQGSDGYYALFEIKNFLLEITKESPLSSKITWNIRKISHRLDRIIPSSLEVIPKNKKKNIQHNVFLHDILIRMCTEEPLRFFFRQVSSSVSSGKMNVRVMNQNIYDMLDARRLEESMNPEDEDGNYMGRMGRTIFSSGSLEVQGKTTELGLGTHSIVIDMRTNLKELLNVISLLYAFSLKSNNMSWKIFGFQSGFQTRFTNTSISTDINIENPYVLLRDRSTGIVHRSYPFQSDWKNQICNKPKNEMPFIWSGPRDAKIPSREKYGDMIYRFPSEEMMESLSGYELASDPIYIVAPKNYIVTFRKAPKKLQSSLASSMGGTNYAYLFDTTICVVKEKSKKALEIEKDKTAVPTVSEYILDSIKDEIPYLRYGDVDPGFMERTRVREHPDKKFYRWGLPNSGYSCFLALSYAFNPKNDLNFHYNELKNFFIELSGGNRTTNPYFYTMWRFFPGGGFLEFQKRMELYKLDIMGNIQMNRDSIPTDDSQLFIDTDIFLHALKIRFKTNIVVMDYTEKNVNNYTPTEFDTLHFAVPRSTQTSLVVQSYTDNLYSKAVILLRRNYKGIHSQYDILGAMNPERKDSPEFIFKNENVLEDIGEMTSQWTFQAENGNLFLLPSSTSLEPKMNLKYKFQFVDTAGLQVGIRTTVRSKYTLNLLWVIPTHVRENISVISLREACNDYDLESVLKLCDLVTDRFKITNYSTIPIVKNRTFVDHVVGFYGTMGDQIQFYVPIHPSPLIPGSGFATEFIKKYPKRPPLYPYNVQTNTPVLYSPIYTELISRGISSLILTCLRMHIVMGILMNIYDLSNPREYEKIWSNVLGVTTVITDDLDSDTRLQKMVVDLRRFHRVPIGYDCMKQMSELKDTSFSLLFHGDSPAGGIRTSTIAKTVNGENTLIRIKEQIRILWKYCSGILNENMFPSKTKYLLNILQQYGSRHPLTRVHFLENEMFFSRPQYGMEIIFGKEILQTTLAVIKRREFPVINTRLWSSLAVMENTGPEFFTNRGIGIWRVEGIKNLSDFKEEDKVPISENDIPENPDEKVIYTVNNKIGFKLQPMSLN